MEKLRAWSTPGTFSVLFLHDRLFGGKGHRKEYNAFFTSSDSLKCLTRKTVSSTLHLSLQLKLIYSQCQEGTGQFCGHLTPAPQLSVPAALSSTATQNWCQAESPVSETFSFYFPGSYTFQEKCHSTSNQSNTQKSTRRIPNRTS